MILQKPAEDQYEKFEYLRRTNNSISKILFSDPFYSGTLKPKLLIPILDKFLQNSPTLYRLFMYILDVKSLSTLTI